MVHLFLPFHALLTLIECAAIYFTSLVSAVTFLEVNIASFSNTDTRLVRLLTQTHQLGTHHTQLSFNQRRNIKWSWTKGEEIITWRIYDLYAGFGWGKYIVYSSAQALPINQILIAVRNLIEYRIYILIFKSGKNSEKFSYSIAQLEMRCLEKNQAWSCICYTYIHISFSKVFVLKTVAETMILV